MKTFLKLVLGLVFLLIVAVVGVAMFVDINSFKPQIIAQAERALGRKVTMDGDIKLRIFPTIAIKTGKVTISNPDWAGGGMMLAADDISLGAELMPLLEKKLKVSTVEIQKPVLLLVKNGEKANWQFGENIKSATPEGAPAVPNQKLDLSVKQVYIGEGDLTFKDLGTRTTQRVQNFNLKLYAPDMQKEINIDSSMKVNGEELKLKANVGEPFSFAQSPGSKLEASLVYGKLSLVYKGNAKMGKVVALKGKLAAGDINLNDPAKKDAKPAARTNGGNQQGRWSDETIDLSALNSAEADLHVEIDSLTVKNMVIKPLKTDLSLHNGQLQFSIPGADIYGGKVTAEVKASARGNLSISSKLESIQAEPFLTDWANNDSITGTLNGAFDFTMNGKSQRQMVSSLGGNANFRFSDGAIKGKNLAANIRRLKAFGGKVEEAPQQTDFSEITGTVVASNGILSNNDLFMKSPLIRLKGEGEVNLPAYQINYKLKPEIVGTLKGQGGKDDAAGLTVPLKVSGDINNPQYSIDAKAALMENLTPDKIEATKENIKALKQQYKEGGGLKGLKSLLGK